MFSVEGGEESVSDGFPTWTLASVWEVTTEDAGRARCAGRGETWSALEARHRAAPTGLEGSALVELMRERFCTGCPALLWCSRWARSSGYTGLAAGFPYEGGERQESTWVARLDHGLLARRERVRRPRSVPPVEVGDQASTA